jgi:hypothetical protein
LLKVACTWAMPSTTVRFAFLRPFAAGAPDPEGACAMCF